MSTLEKISKALAGETLTGLARGAGEAIGYVGAGGDFSDVPQVMKDAIEAQKKRLETGSQGEKDAYSALSALGLVTNPASQIGMGIDLVKALPDLVSAIPERARSYMAGEMEPAGTIAESGLKRRLAKGGAQAEFAKKNQLERAKEAILSQESGAPIIDPDLKYKKVDAFMPISSTGSKWPYGEGKFQVIDDYSTRAYDLAKNTFDPANVMNPKARVRGMGRMGKAIIQGHPHDLGIEFANTIGLAPEYRGKGYGKAIYQNMADVYGGGISHSGSTTPAARNVYESLGDIDTGIPSGGGTRLALPTTEMRKNPDAMAAFEAEVQKYAKKQERNPYTIEGMRKPEDLLNIAKDDADRGITETRIPGNFVRSAFPGSFSDFREYMRNQGFQAEYSGMANMWFIRKQQSLKNNDRITPEDILLLQQLGKKP